MSKIEITIPVLNEQQSLRQNTETVLAYIREELADLGDIQLVIADNGSTDQTPIIAQELCAEFPHIRFVQTSERGVGRALKLSWTTSDADIVGYMDLDLATDLSHLKAALKTLVDGSNELVSGSRLLPDSQVIGRKPMREFTSRVFNKILALYLSTGFTDGMCGFKFLQRKHLESLMQLGAQSDGWFFATEILVCAERLNLRILDLPVKWTDDPNTKANISALTKQYLVAMRDLKRKVNQQNPATH